MEEKYGKNPRSSHRHQLGSDEDIDTEGTDTSTDSEEEDDEGFLATEGLDAQISATLEAIRARDPRVYDGETTFYAHDEDQNEDARKVPEMKTKPMYLSDYHRRNLLRGGADDFDEGSPSTYAQQQNDLQRQIVREMHAVADINDSSGDADGGKVNGDGGFLVRKGRERGGVDSNSAGAKPFPADVKVAEKDPENFLSNFMSSRAWVPSAGSRFQPFESDDEEEERRAEAFEAAYNLRFEDPQSSKEKLMSHARDTAAKYSVRRESTNRRKKGRELEQSRKAAEKLEREKEKARLRKLKVEETEEKIKKIREAAGLKAMPLREQDWSALLEDGWEDGRWEIEMKKRFGDNYYTEQDSECTINGNKDGKTKVKKPKWADEIAIDDLVPGFDEQHAENSTFALDSDNSSAHASDDNEMGGVPITQGSAGGRRSRKRERDEERKTARKERRKIEQVVDSKLDADVVLSNSKSKNAGGFRYRDTSPLAWGLTAHDILMASDSQLNQYAGLKKMATFRDAAKKRKDKQRLGKKARLRQWRKETFGSEEGPQGTLADVLRQKNLQGDVANRSETMTEKSMGGKKKKTRSGKKRKDRQLEG